MNSTIVNKEIRKHIRSLLKKEGFTKFTERNAWRVGERTTEVISFQSFNSYLASVLSCTTFSFGISLGVYYKSVHNNPWSFVGPPLFPKEFECHARRNLVKAISQPEYPRPDIWYLDKAGSWLPKIIDDARSAICDQGFTWFKEMSNLHQALESFMKKPETFIQNSIAIEMLGGQLNSMSRAEVICGIALEFKDVDLAVSQVMNILRNPFYSRMPDVVETLRARMAMLERLN